MRINSNVKPALLGAVGGAVLTMIVGLSGFWMTDGNAEKMANDRAEASLKTVAVNVLAPMCVAQAQEDPEMTTKMVELSTVTGFQRNAKIAETGWTVIEGADLSSANKRALAEACGKLLFEEQPV